MWIEKLAAKLPVCDPRWPQELVDRWFVSFFHLMDMNDKRGVRLESLAILAERNRDEAGE